MVTTAVFPHLLDQCSCFGPGSVGSAALPFASPVWLGGRVNRNVGRAFFSDVCFWWIYFTTGWWMLVLS